ncbi:hypothetical protein B0H15DRAFT_780532 [Mycena belliarum]|uniref:DUF7223 domain-containing protein n=1 Tax=Mycena belliarum TaxID=1033014 RepID=A0AAD6XS38_9AGAR|nr:hypothetical protein B0H15DRAFT_780532 [Mycena belliae]
MISSLLVIVPFLAGINAANDWKVPCISGSCSYDMPGTASGSLKIWGSEDAITDITTAADWHIIGCDPNALSQDIRLVCANPDDPDSKCGHLYQNIGAVNKLVRLPENCGASAFARISKAWVPEDQSIPASLQSRIVRRDGKQPVVKALALDTNFDAVDWSKTGVVNIAIQGANVPGAPTDIKTPGSRRASRSRRGFGDAIKCAPARSSSAFLPLLTHSFAAAVTDGVKNAAEKAKEAVKDAAGAAANNTINVNKAFDLKPLVFNKAVNLIDQSLSCGATSASLRVDMDANANAQASISVAATGTIVPPKMSSFGIVAGLTADVAGTLTMNADLSGRLDSGKINLVTLGVPGFSFPGILTIGPSFKVDAQIVGDVDVAMDMTVGINFNVKNAQLAFPPDAKNKPEEKAFSIGDTPLTLNAAPNVQATGTITAHLIPSLNLGVSALGNKAKAQIFLALDTNAALTMNLDASGDITKTAATDDTAAETTDETATDETATDGELEPIDNASTGGAATDDTAVPDGTTTSKSFGGCVQVDGAINVLAGAEGSFFGLFNKVKSVPLFNKNFRILNKCFGDQATAAKAEAETEKQAAAAEAADAAATIKNASADAAAADKTTDAAAPKRRSASSISVSRRASLGARAVLSCPIGGRKSKSSLTKGTVKSSAYVRYYHPI